MSEIFSTVVKDVVFLLYNQIRIVSILFRTKGNQY